LVPPYKLNAKLGQDFNKLASVQVGICREKGNFPNNLIRDARDFRRLGMKKTVGRNEAIEKEIKRELRRLTDSVPLTGFLLPAYLCFMNTVQGLHFVVEIKLSTQT